MRIGRTERFLQAAFAWKLSKIWTKAMEGRGRLKGQLEMVRTPSMSGETSKSFPSSRKAITFHKRK